MGIYIKYEHHRLSGLTHTLLIRNTHTHTLTLRDIIMNNQNLSCVQYVSVANRKDLLYRGGGGGGGGLPWNIA